MTVAWCERCRCPAPIDASDLTGDGGGDPSLLPVLIPPPGWIGDPDSDGLVCGACATVDEIVEWMANIAMVEQMSEGQGR